MVADGAESLVAIWQGFMIKGDEAVSRTGGELQILDTLDDDLVVWLSCWFWCGSWELQSTHESYSDDRIPVECLFCK